MQFRFQPRNDAFGIIHPEPVRWQFRPACLALLALVAVTSLIAGFCSTRHPITGDFSQGLAPRRWLRSYGVAVGLPALMLDGITAPTMGELVVFFGIVVLAGLHVETVLGSHRFVALLALMMLIRVPLVAAIATVLPWTHTSASWYATRPSVAWLGIALATARRLVAPPTRRFEAFGIPMCDQTASDFLALQMALINGRGFLAEGLLGFVVPAIALSDAVGFMRRHPTALLPRAVVRVLSGWKPHPRVVFARDVRFATHAPRDASADNTAADGNAPVAGAAALAGAVPDPPATTVDALDERHVASLRELGFSEGQCREALRRARGDVHRASAMLLDGDIPMDV